MKMAPTLTKGYPETFVNQITLLIIYFFHVLNIKDLFNQALSVTWGIATIAPTQCQQVTNVPCHC